MTEQDNELFATELRRLQPAPLPAELRTRLEQVPSEPQRQAALGTAAKGWGRWWWLRLRWIAPAAAAGLVLVLAGARIYREPSRPAEGGAASQPALNADQVVIDRTLLTAFETVATLPDGEPVRLQCRQWIESVTLRDSARGIEVEQRAPRLEVVPIRFETY